MQTGNTGSGPTTIALAVLVGALVAVVSVVLFAYIRTRVHVDDDDVSEDTLTTEGIGTTHSNMNGSNFNPNSPSAWLATT